jgi:type II secretory ATPase GspE/PulE/Tfp pilus assembly ATPase PilB-like protein
VERNLGTIAQTEVQPERGVTFPSGLRALLRQDPEVIMVGEIRDPETARIAVQASLSGHLVLSSLHTADACEALSRLRDLGVDTGLAAGALRGLVAQRLVPRGCACEGQDPRCATCRGTGVAGRVAVAELMVITEALRELIRARASSAELEATARAGGFVPLAERLRRLVERGVTRPALVMGGAA